MEKFNIMVCMTVVVYFGYLLPPLTLWSHSHFDYLNHVEHGSSVAMGKIHLAVKSPFIQGASEMM